MQAISPFDGPIPIVIKHSIAEVPPDFRLPTPPRSAQGFQEQDESEDTVISVSNAFFPGVEHTPGSPDLIIMSSDNAFFYVHSYKVLSASNNGFGSRCHHEMPNEQYPPIVAIEESSPVLNLVLHVVYNLPCSQYSPVTDEITEAVNALKKYGFPLDIFAQPNSMLYDMILERAPTDSIHMYALAASHKLEELTTEISSHLLSFDLSELNDEVVEKMGAIYLRRLVFLHLGRVEALKRLLKPPPEFHRPTATCGFREQRKLTKSWSLAIASMAWEARPDLPPDTLQSALGALEDLSTCPMCKEAVQRTVESLLSSWSNIKTTI